MTEEGAAAARDGVSTTLATGAPGGKGRQTQEDRSAATREKLIEGAYRVLRELGHAGLRSANISAAAGVSRGGLLHHYPTKEMLVAAVHEWLMDRMEAASLANIEAAPVGQLLPAIVDDARQRFFGDDYRVALDILIASREGDDRTERASAAEPPQRTEAHVAWAARLARTGIRRDDALQVASFLWYMVRGLAIRSFVSDNIEHDQRVIAFGIKIAREWLAQRRCLDDH